MQLKVKIDIAYFYVSLVFHPTGLVWIKHDKIGVLRSVIWIDVELDN